MSFKKVFGLVSMGALAGAMAVAGCSSSSSGGGGNGTTTDGGPGTTDSGKPGPTKDSGGGPGPSTDGGTCAPADVSSFTPKWHAPKPAAPSCTQAQIDAYHQCLKDGQTQQNPPSCAPFGTNASADNKACVQCILTQDTSAQYGPIVVHKGTIEMNVPGCIAIKENKLDGSGCGGAYQAASECRNAACAANCPVTDQASFDAEQACEQTAGTNGCKTYEDKAACADALQEAGTGGGECLKGQTFDDLYSIIVPIFCGGGTADAATGG